MINCIFAKGIRENDVQMQYWHLLLRVYMYIYVCIYLYSAWEREKKK